MHVCKCTAVHVCAQILSASFFFSTCVWEGMEMCECVYIHTCVYIHAHVCAYIVCLRKIMRLRHAGILII